MKLNTLIKTVAITSAFGIGALAIAHGNGDSEGYIERSGGYGHMSQMMGGTMMGMMSGNMNFDFQAFNTTELTQTLGLSNEQVSALSQLEVSHLMMQELMKSQLQNEDDESTWGHGQMMTFMDDNFQLMQEHMALYEGFWQQLSEEQQATWTEVFQGCH